MINSAIKGNDRGRWEKYLNALDEKLQLGLLDHLRKVAGYHFEGDVLYIEPATAEEMTYLSRDPVLQQLQLHAQDSIGITEVRIKNQ